MCHNSDAVTVAAEENGQQSLPFRLSGSQAKTAYALRKNLDRMISEGGLESTGFLTLTVGDGDAGGFRQVWDAAEASRRINNLNRHVLPMIFERAVVVTERHKSGAIHFHVVGIIRGRPDVRTGFDFAAVADGDYSSASTALRALWQMLRERLPDYGFGRAELTPIRKTGEAIAAYVSKYIEKNLFNRLPEDRRKKLVRYLGWNRRHLKPNEFSWSSPRAAAWRGNAERLSALVGVRNRGEVAEAFGPRWAFRLSRVMNAVVGNDQHVASLGDSFAVRQTARQLVLREARARWVSRRRIADQRQVCGPWRWHYRPPTERRQFTFGAEAEWQTTAAESKR